MRYADDASRMMRADMAYAAERTYARCQPPQDMMPRFE